MARKKIDFFGPLKKREMSIRQIVHWGWTGEAIRGSRCPSENGPADNGQGGLTKNQEMEAKFPVSLNKTVAPDRGQTTRVGDFEVKFSHDHGMMCVLTYPLQLTCTLHGSNQRGGSTSSLPEFLDFALFRKTFLVSNKKKDLFGLSTQEESK